METSTRLAPRFPALAVAPGVPLEISDDGLWDPITGAFVGVRLHRAIVARGWTLPEFALVTRLHLGSVYNAVKGKAVRDATAIRIFEALEKRRPMMVAVR
jgi:hypothetical protein